MLFSGTDMTANENSGDAAPGSCMMEATPELFSAASSLVTSSVHAMTFFALSVIVALIL